MLRKNGSGFLICFISLPPLENYVFIQVVYQEWKRFRNHLMKENFYAYRQYVNLKEINKKVFLFQIEKYLFRIKRLFLNTIYCLEHQ